MASKEDSKYPLGDDILDLAKTVFPALKKHSKELFLQQIIKLYLETEGEKPEKITELVTGMIFKKVLK